VQNGAAADAVHVAPPGDDVTVYPVIGDPPSGGAYHDTTADPVPAFASTPVGGEGAVGGTMRGTIAVTSADAVATFPSKSCPDTVIVVGYES
jgi:hypothetical protein